MDRIVDLLTLAGLLAMVALPVSVLINTACWRLWRNAVVEAGGLKRRIADLEALSRKPVAANRCTVPPAGWQCTRANGHSGPCAAIPARIMEHLGDPLEEQGSGRAMPRACGDGGE